MFHDKVIKLGFTDTFDPVPEFFTEIFSLRYQVVRDDENPEYLIFGDRNFGYKNTYYRQAGLTKIFYTGENERPMGYDCDFSFSFDHDELRGRNMNPNPTNLRLPLYVLNMWHQETKLDIPSVFSLTRMSFDIERKTDFCGFVNSNPNCVERNKFFHKLFEYQKVDSGGPLFNNTGYVLPRGEDGIQQKLDFLSDKKFTIAYENGSHPGYATEKMLEAYIAGTIPIYWGSPTIEVDFNPRCFLNRYDYVSDEKFIQRIKEVNENRSEYLKMYLEPLFVDDQPNKFISYDRVLDFFDTNIYGKKNRS